MGNLFSKNIQSFAECDECEIKADMDLMRRFIIKEVLNHKDTSVTKKKVFMDFNHMEVIRHDPFPSNYRCRHCKTMLEFNDHIMPIKKLMQGDRVCVDAIYCENFQAFVVLVFKPKFMASLKWKKLRNVLHMLTAWNRFLARYYEPPYGKGYVESMNHFKMVMAN